MIIGLPPAHPCVENTGVCRYSQVFSVAFWWRDIGSDKLAIISYPAIDDHLYDFAREAAKRQNEA
jgi:hypothetical protein